MTGYIIVGCGYTGSKVYTNKDKAEKVREMVQENLAFCGSYNTVGIKEIEIDTEEA